MTSYSTFRSESQNMEEVSLTLRSVDDLAPCFRCLYPFKYFNVVQSDSFEIAYQSDENMVVAAPTGCGKTNVMELCMLRLFSRNLAADGMSLSKPGSMKVIYIAPTRSLVQERVRDWKERFQRAIGANVAELTGDIENVKSQEIGEADVICATPEKFDAVSRKHKDHGGTRFFAEISLVLIDEVHLLNENRGSVLEAGVVSRVRVVSKLASMRQFPISNVRFVAVSATIPNAQDLATWLNVSPRGLLIYGEEVRPVAIKTIVKGYSETRNDFLFERRLNDFLFPVIIEHSKNRPSLVFCSTRKGTSDTAHHLIQQISFHAQTSTGTTFVRDGLQRARLMELGKKASNKQLQQCLPHGIAFHHAGMDASDRSLVEMAFAQQDILVLCTTGTLAMGVNLPAHLVVIKGTRYYCGQQESEMDQNGMLLEPPFLTHKECTGYKEYERGTCLQMIGRAGRPQFDTEGVAVIMTQRKNVQRYENLAMGCEELESQLKTCFAEYLNAEIVLGTVRNLPLAIEWLRSSFMYIRAMRNPLAYGLPLQISNQVQFDALLTERLINSNLQLLQKHKLIQIEQDGSTLTALECGRLMAYYYIRLNTMIRICEAPTHASIPDLIQIISKAEELETIRLRRGEKRTLNDINGRKTNASIKFQVLEDHPSRKPKQRISTADEKIFVLINDALSETASDTLDVSMRQEIGQILKVAETVCRCMTKHYSNIGHLASSANARILLKCIKMRMWEDSIMQSKQLPNIGKLLSERLAKAGIGKLKQLIQADPRRIETATQKNFPFGNTLLQDLQKRMPPDVDLQIYPIGHTGDGKIKIQIVLTRQNETESCQTQFMAAHLLCGSIHNDRLLIHQPINLKTFHSPYSVLFYVDRLHQKPVEIVATVIIEKIVGLDLTKKLTIPYDFQPMQWIPVHQNEVQNAAQSSAPRIQTSSQFNAPQIQRLPLSNAREVQKLLQSNVPETHSPKEENDLPLMQPLSMFLSSNDTKAEPNNGVYMPSSPKSKPTSIARRSQMGIKDGFLSGSPIQNENSIPESVENGVELYETVSISQSEEEMRQTRSIKRTILQPLQMHSNVSRLSERSSKEDYCRTPLPSKAPKRKNGSIERSNRTQSTEPALLFLRQKSDRTAMDWSSRARSIIEARREKISFETEIFDEEASAKSLVKIWNPETVSRGQKRRDRPFLDDFASKKKPRFAQNLSSQRSSRTVHPIPLTLPTARSNIVPKDYFSNGIVETKDHTENDKVSIFSFL